jgi:hypothetical protein
MKEYKMEFEMQESKDLMMSLLNELNMSFDFFDDYFKERDIVKEDFGFVVSDLPKSSVPVKINSKDISFFKIIMSLGVSYS